MVLAGNIVEFVLAPCWFGEVTFVGRRDPAVRLSGTGVSAVEVAHTMTYMAKEACNSPGGFNARSGRASVQI